jgi:hypothetical protein
MQEEHGRGVRAARLAIEYLKPLTRAVLKEMDVVFMGRIGASSL